MKCEHEWSDAEPSADGSATRICRKCKLTVSMTFEPLPAVLPNQRREKACDHLWVVVLATLEGGPTFHSAYRCQKCGDIAGVCQAGDHPFGYPDFRGRTGVTCDWCQSPNPFEKH
jgi:hypothetical protein